MNIYTSARVRECSIFIDLYNSVIGILIMELVGETK